MRHIRTYSLFESLSSVLYHFTRYSSLVEILRDDEISLTMSAGSKSDQALNKGKFYFLSMQTTRNGGYGQRRNLEVMLVMDGSNMNHKFKGGPANYWNLPGLDDTHRVEADEFEERMFADVGAIKATKYVKEIHVLVSEYKDEEMQNMRAKEIGYAAKRSKELGIPIYFYDNKSDYFNNRKSKAINITEFTESPEKTKRNVWSGITLLAMMTPKEDMNKVAKEVVDLGFVAHLKLQGLDGSEIDFVTRQMNKFYDNHWPNMTEYKIEDMYRSLDADIHNNRSTNDPFYKWVFQKMIKEFKRTKSSGLKEYIQKIYGNF